MYLSISYCVSVIGRTKTVFKSTKYLTEGGAADNNRARNTAVPWEMDWGVPGTHT